MALFKFGSMSRFRLRSPQRDHETDAARAERLNGLLDDLRAEIERESNGLRDRYDSVSIRAAFSQQALEDNEAAAMSPVIEDLTNTMIRYSARLTALEKQIAFVTELRGQAGLFPHANEGTGAADLTRRNRRA